MTCLKYLKILKYHKGHLKYSELVCVSPLLCTTAAELTCRVATQAAMSSSAPYLIYSQTLIRHMRVNTLWCTSFTLRPHVPTNTFTIGTVHLTAAWPDVPSASFYSHKPVIYPASLQSNQMCNLARTGLNTFSRNFCFLSIQNVLVFFQFISFI